MLIIALVLALIGLVALVFAVVTSNEVVAWACIAASALGVVLLIVDALRERRLRDAGTEGEAEEGRADDEASADEEASADDEAALDYPEESEGDAAESAAPEEAAERPK